MIDSTIIGTVDRLSRALRASTRLCNSLSDDQSAAVAKIETWLRSPSREFYLAGYAGTGKTTIAAGLIASSNLRVCVATYTGKAASVLRKKGVWQAQTIHSLIYEPIPDSEPVRFRRAMTSDLSAADLLIIDECSMVGDDIADDLRSYDRKILVLGDPGQLPPIRGGGAFTNREPDAFLSEIHRQAAGSPVLRLATMARQGLAAPLSNGPDATVAPLTMTRALAAEGQLICGTHRARWAVTREIRKRDGRTGIVPNVGERVICCRNDRDLGIYNGMLGSVVEVLDDGGNSWNGNFTAMIQMDDHAQEIEATIEPTLFREHYEGRNSETPRRYQRGVSLFDFGYVLTAHKAQGSEFPDVTVIDDSEAFRENRHRWLYTALTRASERVTLLVRRK